MDLNRVMLIGRLSQDPELRSLPSGKSVCTFGLATGRQWKDANGAVQKQTEFHNIVLWGKLGEIANQYLRKGRTAYIEGRLQTRDWMGKDNVKRYRTEIVADNMIMLGGNPGTAGAPSNAPTAASYDQSAPAPMSDVVEEEIKVEDIPF
ncbi:MAG: single-stranded DNA-binding protein [Candidatus Magasanikbacteria bacterium]|jgi:single-strand DNA-binding protein